MRNHRLRAACGRQPLSTRSVGKLSVELAELQRTKVIQLEETRAGVEQDALNRHLDGWSPSDFLKLQYRVLSPATIQN